MKTTLSLIIMFCLSVSGFFQAQAMAADDAATAAPATIEWVLNTLDGQQINVGEHIRTPKNRIMVFWATWCPYCKQLMPIVNDIKRDYPDLEVMAFNVFDDLEPEAYASKANWPFMHLLDGDDFATVHGVKGLPTLFVVNEHGKMVIDLREIDTKSTLPKDAASNRAKASHHAPLWDSGLRATLDKLNWPAAGE